MSIIEQIKSNSITDLKLSMDPDEIADKASEIIDALKNNMSIVSVRFEGEFLGGMRNDPRREVIEAIGCIPTLQRVHLADALVLASAITKMLCSAKSLRELSISNLLLQGIESDFSSFETALASHANLKLFKMEECKPAVKDISLEGLKTSATLRSNISAPVHNKQQAMAA